MSIAVRIKSLFIRCIFFCCIPVMLLSFQSGKPTNNLRSATSPQTYKPWAYWWWMGNSVTKEGISQNLQSYRKAGLGGLHIIPIYGEKGDEKNFIQYLSPRWMELLVHTVQEAEKLGMGIDMTTGTGWPFGGPNIDIHNAAKRFVIKPVDLDTIYSPGDITKRMDGAELMALSVRQTNGSYENILANIKAGTTTLPKRYSDKAFALLMLPTKQQVKRAAPGGEGPVMDYFNRQAINRYFERFESAFKDLPFRSGRVRAFYNDSYEVYGANFTDRFLDTFKALRGYDLTGYLDILADSNRNEQKERIVTDYCETISDLLYSGFTVPWVSKTHAMGKLTRNQAHGSPGNLLDLYAASDIPETESFGASGFSIPGVRQDPDFEEQRFGRPNPLTMKFASSAAHITNKKLVSSETATWLGDHFKVALSQIKPQIDELFTAGINHIVYHGITYNPPDKPFPGRLFYASTNFGPLSHFWNELPALNKYVERCQEVLQNTKPDNDVLVYFPIHDIWAKKYTNELIVKFDVHHSDKWLQETNFGKLVSQLWEQGFGFDYVSDKMIAEAVMAGGKIQFGGGSYRALVVPELTYLPEKTLEKIDALVKKGARVIFENHLPLSVPGWANLLQRNQKLGLLKAQLQPLVKITPAVTEALNCAGIQQEELASLGLSFIRKIKSQERVYFISNLGNRFSKGVLHLSSSSKQVEMINPLKGESGIIPSAFENGKTTIRLQLEPGESRILICHNRIVPKQQWLDDSVVNKALTIHPEWTITPISDSAHKPATIHCSALQSWTNFGTDWSVFSGKAVYTGGFRLEDRYIGQNMLIDLGDVRETARLKINDIDLGLLWCVPYKTIIPRNLLKEKNKIEIEVTNLSFNKVIELDRKGVQWKNFHEINFVNIRYEPYNAADKAPVASGLLSDIQLFPMLNKQKSILEK